MVRWCVRAFFQQNFVRAGVPFSSHLLHPLRVGLDEVLFDHDLPRGYICVRHVQPALLGEPVAVQVGRADAQPLDVRGRQVGGVVTATWAGGRGTIEGKLERWGGMGWPTNFFNF